MKRFSPLMRIFIMLCLLLSILALSPVQPAHAGITCTVTSTLDDGSFGTFRDCIAAANSNPNSTITFSITGTITLTSGQLTLSNNMTISGPGANQLTINGNGSNRIFDVGAGATVTISGLTVTNGSESTAGGGIRNLGNLTLDDMIIAANVATGAGSRGGGIYNQNTLTINNSTISSNTAKRDGGGIASETSTVLALNGVVVTGNSVSELGGKGGGVAVFSMAGTISTMTMDDSTVSLNTANTNGGGIAFVSVATGTFGTLTITDSVISGNNVTYALGGRGGGISIDSMTTATLTNTTISSNTAPDNGGGIAIFGTTVSLNNVTIASNTGLQGGGVFATSAFAVNSTLNTKNSIIADNAATSPNPPNIADCYVQGGDTLNSQDYNLIENLNGCLVSGATTHNIIGSDPVLGPLTNNGGPTMTHALLTGSPAIDTADNATATCTATDQRGISRPRDGDNNGSSICDMGAFERKSNVTATYRSVGSYDGWILESAEASGVGGSLDSTATTFRLGDDNLKKQYRGILSFSTGAGLPDNAIITKVTLKVKRQGVIGGGNPVATFQGFMVDIKRGFFGTTALQTTDFQAAAHKTYGPFVTALSGGWYSIDLTSGKGYINKLSTLSGLTQIRLRFKVDDNGNAIANYLSLFSGNAPVASRPQLIIEYYVP